MTGPRLLEDLDALGLESDPIREILAEHGEFPADVAGTDDQFEAAATDLVHDGGVFRHPHRVVQRQDEGGDPNADPFGSGRNGCREDQRRRVVAVLRTVMLEDPHRVESELIGPLALVEAGLEQVGLRRAELGRPDVITQREIHLSSPVSVLQLLSFFRS